MTKDPQAISQNTKVTAVKAIVELKTTRATIIMEKVIMEIGLKTKNLTMTILEMSIDTNNLKNQKDLNQM